MDPSALSGFFRGLNLSQPSVQEKITNFKQGIEALQCQYRGASEPNFKTRIHLIEADTHIEFAQLYKNLNDIDQALVEVFKAQVIFENEKQDDQVEKCKLLIKEISKVFNVTIS